MSDHGLATHIHVALNDKPSWKLLHDFFYYYHQIKQSHKSMDLPNILVIELGRWLMARQGCLFGGLWMLLHLSLGFSRS